MEPAVSVQRLSVTYRRRGLASPAVRALRDLDLQAQRGEIVGVLGPNGSGKTTLLEVLAGTLAPSSGQVRLFGLEPTDRGLLRRVGYQPDGPLPLPHLTGAEFLAYVAALQGLRRAPATRAVEELLDRLELTAASARVHGTYSAGMTRRLGLACALLADPDVLLLDEPTAGLDPQGSLVVLEILRERAAANRTVLLASHHLQEIELVCDRVHLLAAGQCRATGTLDELLDTGNRRLVVRGLDEAALRELQEVIRRAGGEVVEIGRERQQLMELFRTLTAAATSTGTAANDAR